MTVETLVVTTVPEVLDALVPKVAEALPGRQVLDGWDRNPAALRDRVIVIGFAPTPGTPSVTSSLDQDEGGFRSVETLAIACTAAVWDGNSEYSKKRLKVYEDLRLIRELLDEESKASERLGGLVLDAYIGEQSTLYQESDEKGTTAQVDFTIVVRVVGP